MKPSWSLLLSSIYCSAAASQLGHVFVYDPVSKAAPQQPPSVSAETARLILAQRLGLSRFHSIKQASEEVIAQINTYGGRRQQLFGAGKDKEQSLSHTLVWIDDVEEIDAIMKDVDRTQFTEFTISDAPASSDNTRLIQDMIVQAESIPTPYDPMGHTYSSGISAEAALKEYLGKSANTYNDYLTILHADKTDKLLTSDISTGLRGLLDASQSQGKVDWPITVVFMPPSSSHSKRSTHPYGTYDVPSAIEARREKTEAPLSPPSSEPSTTPKVPDLEDFPTIFTAAANDTPVLGILPTCFQSEDACKRRTNGCSGHGNCRRSRTATDKKLNDCWSCSCNATVVHTGHEEGMETKTKTTYWGGPACQKKDVSVPFFLFAGTGVVLAFLIAGGIGLLYSMGSEELPSVIGAGVSGPRAK
ncbi:hypothetical protein K491DRAFT_782797 [Lophiostoma macrostomum CBS 122681]|uniref:Uncharacterized protein n=1 Tax=Lophiostoma macrostomum CBS 122681 TaxID=1314788 RepID=A0A6A6ST43_9PLEO|nr:hypothetical protein K491DRAFT_782797 [Lophiostoma macrostomum CBS 122681]